MPPSPRQWLRREIGLSTGLRAGSPIHSSDVHQPTSTRFG